MSDPTLQNWDAPLDTESHVREAVEKAFDYRGDITLTLRDETTLEGYIFDRNAEDLAFDLCTLRLLTKDSDKPREVRYTDLTRLVFSGRDTAAGKSFETWVKKYTEKKAAGETNISLEPEALS